MISVCFVTNRKEPRIRWFFDSLHRELGGDYSGVKIIVVDKWCSWNEWLNEDDEINGGYRHRKVPRMTSAHYSALLDKRMSDFQNMAHSAICHVPPKPTVWAGAFTRRTSQDYFAPSNARNTGLCLAPDGYIAYVDDLSVLLPGWWEQVQKAVVGNYIACGTYQKVNKLEVTSGDVVSWDETESGIDSRKQFFTSDEPFKCGGGWMYGCSMAIPVEALLTINGFDEDHDSMGGEDTAAGIMLERNGFELRMCPKMKTFESEEDHHVEKPAKRIIKPQAGYKDASHAILDWIQNGNRIKAPNYQDMRQTRESVLNGEKFPNVTIPEHHWPDGVALKDM